MLTCLVPQEIQLHNISSRADHHEALWRGLASLRNLKSMTAEVLNVSNEGSLQHLSLLTQIR